MPASVHRDPDTGIWIFRLSGVVEPKQVLEAYQEMRASPAFRPDSPRLWDARETEGGPAVAALDLVRMARSKGSEAPHRVAVLVQRDVDFGLSRIFQAHSEDARQQATVRVFRDRAAALAWLLGEASSPEER